MIKNKITILILSTLISVNAFSDVVIVKDTPEFINTSEKFDEIERHLYIISAVNINALKKIDKEKKYLLEYANTEFNSLEDFPSESNRPDIKITSKSKMLINDEYQKIIDEYNLIDEIESEIRKEKEIELKANIFKNEKIIKDINDKLENLARETRPYLNLEQSVKDKIEKSKLNIETEQNKVIFYFDNFIKEHNINDTSLSNVTLSRTKRVESKCPSNGFIPNGNSSMSSFYYFQVQPNICLITNLSPLKLKTVNKLMKDESFIALYENSLKTLTEESVRLEHWRFKYSYRNIIGLKSEMRAVQKKTRPEIRRIENEIGYTTSALNIKKTRLLSIIEEENRIIELKMIDFDESYLERKKTSSDYISFDDYIDSVNKYFYEQVSNIYDENFKQDYYSDYEYIDLDDINEPAVIAVDYIDNKAEVFYINKLIAYKYRFEVRTGWNKSSLDKLLKKNAVKYHIIPIRKGIYNDIIDITFDDIINK